MTNEWKSDSDHTFHSDHTFQIDVRPFTQSSSFILLFALIRILNIAVEISAQARWIDESMNRMCNRVLYSSISPPVSKYESFPKHRFHVGSMRHLARFHGIHSGIGIHANWWELCWPMWNLNTGTIQTGCCFLFMFLLVWKHGVFRSNLFRVFQGLKKFLFQIFFRYDTITVGIQGLESLTEVIKEVKKDIFKMLKMLKRNWKELDTASNARIILHNANVNKNLS